MIAARFTVIALPFFLCAVVLCMTERACAEPAKKVYRENKDTLLLFDENTPKFENFYLDIKEYERLKPRPNDFELIEFAPMSNKRGERWAMVTVRNTAKGRRFLKREYIVATFANKHQAYPSASLDDEIEGEESLTITIPFGTYKFPIVLLEIQP
jgi:hypothetical protein